MEKEESRRAGEHCSVRRRKKEGQAEEGKGQGPQSGFPVLPAIGHGPHLKIGEDKEEFGFVDGSYLSGMDDGGFRCWPKATLGVCCCESSYLTLRS